MTLTAGAFVRAEPVMGTVVSFHLYPGDIQAGVAEAAGESACRRLHELEAIFSTWKRDSPMSLLRAGRLTTAEAPFEIAVVSELCAKARAMSGGWFDPWAIPGGMDPTGLVKGWAVEEALSIVRHAGVPAAMVNGGGDIAVLGSPPEADTWRIGIRHPWRPDAFACVIETCGAIATSGSYERGQHLINPKPGTAPVATASATVTGPSLAMADALATALAVGGDLAFELFSSLDGYDAYLIGADGCEHATPGIVFA